ncbi:MAG: hypothetical protein ACOCX9_06830 [Spirochaetota bacterium]
MELKPTATRLLKTVFIWIPLTLAFLLVITLLAVWLYVTPRRMEQVITNQFAAKSNGTIQLHVADVNPYSGFEIHDLVIKSGPDFGGDILARIDVIRVKYDFFSLFLGDIHLHEIGIYRPRVYMQWKDGHWNIASLMKSLPAEEEPVDDEKPLEEIRFPIHVEFLMNMVMENLEVHVQGPSYRSSLKNFSASAKIRVPPFKRIPMSLEALSLLERMQVDVNPEKTLDLSFYSDDATVEPPLLFTWRLRFDKTRGEKQKFLSLLKAGTYRAPVRFKRSHLAPMNFLISYDIQYEPDKDFLNLRKFTVSMKKRNWISLSGHVKGVTSRQDVSLNMLESDIPLDDVYPYYQAVTGDSKRIFKGSLSLYPFSVAGKISSLNVTGALKGRNLEFSQDETGIQVSRMSIPFSASKRGSDIKINTSVNLPSFIYTLERSRSGANGVHVNADLSLVDNMKTIIINGLSIRHHDPLSGNSSLRTGMTGRINVSPRVQGLLHVKSLMFDRNSLEPTLTGNLKKTLRSVKLKQKIHMSSSIGFHAGDTENRLNVEMRSSIPDLDVTDLSLEGKVVQNTREKKIYLEKVLLSSRLRNLTLSCKGMLELKSEPFSDSDLLLKVRMNSPQMKPVYNDWKMSGLVELDTRIKGDLENGMASGKILIDNVNVQEDKSRTNVESVYLDFPFQYRFTPRYRGESLLVVKKSDIINNRFFQEKDNFKIKSVKSRHPVRDIQFEYLKDMSGRIHFRDNVMEINSLRAYVLNGSLYGKNLLFNLADMKTKNMEYQLILDISNIDIARLDEPNPRKKEKGTKVSMNANLSGRGIDFSRELDMKGSVHIYKIGDKFARQLLTGLNREKGKSKLGIGQIAVDNSLRVESFDFNLESGLVYTTVHFQRNLFGYTISVKDEEVKYERMPVQEFLRKVREGE